MDGSTRRKQPKVADRDCSALDEQLTALDFKVRIYENLTEEKLKTVARSAAKEDHSERDCILVVILTDGDDNTDDSLFSYDKPYIFKKVWSKFTADKCKTLAGKPKIFLIQAYQSVTSGGSDSPPSQSAQSADSNGNETKSYRIPDQADFLLVYAAPPVCTTSRSLLKGSRFIQSFCSQLKENGTKLELLKLMTRVLRQALHYEVTNTPDIDNRYDDYSDNSDNSDDDFEDSPTPIPVIQSMLTRKFFFTTKHADEVCRVVFSWIVER